MKRNESVESTVALVNRLVKDASERARVFDAIAEKEREGYLYQHASASLQLLIARMLNGKRLPFTVKEYHVSARGGDMFHECEATVKVIIRGAQYLEVSDGDGPVGALDGALRVALERVFPDLVHVKLDDYSVRLVGKKTGVNAKTCVLISTYHEADPAAVWWTMGVSTNVLEASLLALTDSLEYALLRK